MAYWDGRVWVDEAPAPARGTKSSRLGKWAATAVMMLGLVALVLPFAGVSASTRKGTPTLSVGCASACLAGAMTVGSSLDVHGRNFTPSAGGQQVILWIEYPGDYCVGSTCHGFYAYPWVRSDGTFDVSYDNATLQSGQGGVKATQYNARTDKWVSVSYVDFDVN